MTTRGHGGKSAPDNKNRTTAAAAAGLLLAALLLPPPDSLAKVSGACANCHTMHNSEAGGSMLRAGAGSNPLPSLLRNTCLGCHTGTNDGTFDGSWSHVPRVLTTSEPEYGSTGTETTPATTTLAGGNFFWTMVDEYTGHNVAGIVATSRIAPGGTTTGPLNCAGTSGCHGNAAVADPYLSLSGSHHSNDMSAWKDGSSVAKSYRFLNGVQGFEAPNYEYQPTKNAHNKYYGIHRASENDSGGTISSLCGRCHGDFHHGAGRIANTSAPLAFGDGVWLRHPTDFDMKQAKTSSEYTTYNGGSGIGNDYSVIAPVATESTSAAVNATVYSSGNDAVLMCLSCHRAHGTKFTYSLRWNYRQWPAAGGYNGCALCHTSKN